MLGATDVGMKVGRRLLEKSTGEGLGQMIREHKGSVALHGMGGLVGFEGGVETPPSITNRNEPCAAKQCIYRLQEWGQYWCQLPQWGGGNG
eukprot:12920894-Prorocentrum_lima.AAC.1